MRFQLFFMLITIQPLLFASSESAGAALMRHSRMLIQDIE
jgi:hypothetical protein